MAGLLNQGMAQQPQGQPQQGQRNPQVDMDPEQAQAMYDALIGAMLNTLYSDALDGVRQVLQQSQRPEEGIAKSVATIMLTAYQAITEQGSTVPPGIMFQAAMELSRAVGEIAVRMGMLPTQGNGEPIEAGFMLALGQFGQQLGEAGMSPEQRQRYAEMIRTMRELKQQHGGGGQPPQQAGQVQPRPQPHPEQPPVQEVR